MHPLQFHSVRPQLTTLEDRLAPAGLTPTAIPSNALVVLSESGGNVTVHFVDPVRNVDYRSLSARAYGFAGPVTAAIGDVNGDGVNDIVLAAAKGSSRLLVIDGKTDSVLADFDVFGANFGGGLSVALGDVNGDGTSDLILGAGAGGGPRVRILDAATLGRTALNDYFAFDTRFRGGVTVASGDIDGDGKADVVLAAGPGGGPHVKAFKGASTTELKSYFAFDPTFRGGVNLATADTDDDRKADIIAGSGVGGGPRVRVFASSDAKANRDFFADDPSFRDGARVDGVRLNDSSRFNVRVRHADQEIIRSFTYFSDAANGGFRRVISDNPKAFPPESDDFRFGTKNTIFGTIATVEGTVEAVGPGELRVRVDATLAITVPVGPAATITRNGSSATLESLGTLTTVEQVRVVFDNRGRVTQVAFTSTSAPLPNPGDAILFGRVTLITSSRIHIYNDPNISTPGVFTVGVNGTNSVLPYDLDPNVVVVRNGVTITLAAATKFKGDDVQAVQNSLGKVTAIILTPLANNGGFDNAKIVAISLTDVTYSLPDGSTVTAPIAADAYISRNYQIASLSEVLPVAVGEHAQIYRRANGEVSGLYITTPQPPFNSGVTFGIYTGTLESVTATNIRLRVSPTRVIDLAIRADLNVTLNGVYNASTFAALGQQPAGTSALVSVLQDGYVSRLDVNSPANPATALDTAAGSYIIGDVVGVDRANNLLYIRGSVNTTGPFILPGNSTTIYRVRYSENTELYYSPVVGYNGGGLSFDYYGPGAFRLTTSEYFEVRGLFSRVSAYIGSNGQAVTFTDYSNIVF